MKLLVDTHALLWWLFDDPKLSRRARTAIGNPENSVFCSSASAWEIATKHRLGKLPEAEEAVMHLPALLRAARMEVLPISVEHALAAGSLGGAHKDPFDRMLIAQAQLERMPIVTSDPAFRKFRIEILW
ncbi:MAG: type II toxin-antitoxin system VapC family toxin [Betaproteobacteria bacterium]|nr:type II toxin-antitoxin system VapC family toxin [Betaproteobacteria bacterium]